MWNELEVLGTAVDLENIPFAVSFPHCGRIEGGHSSGDACADQEYLSMHGSPGKNQKDLPSSRINEWRRLAGCSDGSHSQHVTSSAQH